MNKYHEIRAWICSLRHVPSFRALIWHLRQIVRIVLWDERGTALIKSALCVPLVLFAAVGLLLVVNNIEHANACHLEAEQIRAAFKSRYDNDIELYYSVTRGTILALLRIEDNRYGGIVWRVTENLGARWLDSECYECTAFIHSHAYWNRVLKRDRYMPLVAYPSIQQQYHNWILSQFGDW